MPFLFVGSLPDKKKRKVWLPGFNKAHGSSFTKWADLDKLAPRSRLHAVANFWHMGSHTVFAWHLDELKHEQMIVIPQLIDQREALELARITFPDVIPSPIIFRFHQDYHEVLSYD